MWIAYKEEIHHYVSGEALALASQVNSSPDMGISESALGHIGWGSVQSELVASNQPTGGSYCWMISDPSHSGIL